MTIPLHLNLNQRKLYMNDTDVQATNTDWKPTPTLQPTHKNYKLVLQIWLVNNNVVPGSTKMLIQEHIALGKIRFCCMKVCVTPRQQREPSPEYWLIPIPLLLLWSLPVWQPFKHGQAKQAFVKCCQFHCLIERFHWLVLFAMCLIYRLFLWTFAFWIILLLVCQLDWLLWFWILTQPQPQPHYSLL